jgi:hypothetical protein
MDENRLSQIENEIQRLNQRIDNLKSLMLGSQSTTASTPMQAQEVVRPAPVQALPSVILDAKGQVQVAPTTSIGKYASLGVISVIFFLIAAAYALNLAYQSGYLTPQGILFLLTALGVGLIGSGFMSFTQDKKFQSFLPVAGILILNAVFYTASAVYGMIGPFVALMVTMGVSTLGIFLYEEFKFDVYWIISILGAYFFPLLLKLNSDLMLWNSFLIISSFGFVAAGIFVNKRPISLMACICSFIAVATRQSEYTDFMPIIFLAIHLTIFLGGFIVYFRRSKQMLERGEAYALFAMGVFFHIYSEVFAQKAGPQTEIIVTVATITGFFILQRYINALLDSEQKEKSYAIEALDSILYFLVSSLGYVIALQVQWRPLFVILMMSLTFAFLAKKITQSRRLFSAVVGVCLFGMFFYEYGSMLFFENTNYKELTWFWMFAWGLAIIFNEKRLSALPIAKNVSQKFWIGYYGLGHILLLKLLWLVLKNYGQDDIFVLYVTLYAGVFVFLGFKLKIKNLAKSSLPILVFISALLLLGLGLGSPMVKIFSFLGAGVAFWGAGFLLRKIDRIN